MNIIVIISVIIIFLALLKLFGKDTNEGLLGTLTQLHAKGIQDTHLTGDAHKYLPYFYPYYYPQRIWNNSTRLNTHHVSPYMFWNRGTRLQRYHYPLYGLKPLIV